MDSTKKYSLGTENSGHVIDLRSDTVTKPDAEMRKAMAEAEVGDDVYGEDPTVNKLQERCASLLGKEAALFVPSGTMANLISVMSHCPGRGEEVILGDQSHIFIWEQGGISQLAGVHPRTVKNKDDGTFDIKEAESKIRSDDVHLTVTRLICVENTFGGKPLPLQFLKDVRKVADKHNLSVHMDGARLMNAAVAMDTAPQNICQYADSISMCFSKGLGAPVGSIIAGSKAFIDRSLRHRKVLGGGMRQAGILAAAALLGLDRATEKIKMDHDNAKRLAQGILDIKNDHLSVCLEDVLSNMVMIKVNKGINPMSICQAMARVTEEEESKLGCIVNLKMFPGSKTTIRAVVHQNISKSDIELAIKKIQIVLDSFDDGKGYSVEE
ncbi:uncharacterized protein [Antedon mediterranea]|uniref:uncharacterized protein isoform X2 n=1 Tax=Antedon mediterranea TaxID=105859 RepID=UPI003AF7BAC3